MKKLEELFNSLIKRGWKPRGFETDKIYVAYSTPMLVGYDKEGKPIGQLNPRSLRELVSIESGLWQFVCENGLLSDKVDSRDYLEDSYGFQSYSLDKDGWFWLMKSATIPEEMLEKFLLDSVKIED